MSVVCTRTHIIFYIYIKLKIINKIYFRVGFSGRFLGQYRNRNQTAPSVRFDYGFFSVFPVTVFFGTVFRIGFGFSVLFCTPLCS